MATFSKAENSQLAILFDDKNDLKNVSEALAGLSEKYKEMENKPILVVFKIKEKQEAYGLAN